MPFSTRVFCRESTAPTLTELVAWQRQHGTPVMLAGGRSAADLLSPFWTEAKVSYDPDEAPFVLRCHHAGDQAGAARLREEVADFLTDLGELPDSPARARVMAQIQATRFLLVVEFPDGGVGARGYETNGWLMSLFVERAGGMVQCDGIGFYDEHDEIILRLG
ncbi:MAG TPA: hypothetical protein VFH68_08900 [Polyangia bacterium]|jgi:hypothetical protein|nr:hypothetical protein [Polyangia bacterium]